MWGATGAVKITEIVDERYAKAKVLTGRVTLTMSWSWKRSPNTLPGSHAPAWEPVATPQRRVSQTPIELVVARDGSEAKDNPVLVYVTDHASAGISTAGANGIATLLVGQQKITVTLTPSGDNLLKGGRYAATPNQAIVSVTLADKTAEQARFTPMAKAERSHTGH
ncbi:hypothetical protein CCP4SC76_7060005 [Gammaproteobacteria bacterium]